MTIQKIGNGTQTIVADKADTTYQMAASRTLTTTTYGISVQGLAENRILDIDGKIDATFAAITIGSAGDTAPVTVDIGKTARLTSDDYALNIEGRDNVIRNAGHIHGTMGGIETYGAQTVINTGSISGTSYGINIHAGDGDTVIIRNSGTISGGTIAVYGAATDDLVTNTGKIKGDVTLGGGDDTFYFKAGSVDGIVRGGWDNDTYYIRKSGLDIVENADEGTDLIQSWISHKLEDNVEVLFLRGHKNIDGTGSAGYNQIVGNAGKNRIDGGAGMDSLNGGKGNDVLTGGSEADEFVFQLNSGRDTVTDFVSGVDRMEMDYLKGAKDFTDMIDNHTEMKHGDTIITYGQDTLVLKDVDADQLVKADFFFY